MHKFPLILVSIFLSINTSIAQWEFIGSPETGRAFHYAKDGDRLFVCAKAGLYYSDDDGLTWAQVNTAPVISTANKVLADNGVIYLLTNEDPILQYLYKYDLFRSKNFGETWENIYPFNYINFTFLPPLLKGDTLLLVGDDSIAISTDNGDHFKKVKSTRTELVQILFHQNKLIGVEENEIYESDDLGITWTHLYTFPSHYYGGLLVSDGTDLYSFHHSSKSRRDISKSIDGGHSWTYQGGFGSLFMQSPSFFGSNGSLYVFEPFIEDLLYHSHTDGTTWSHLINYMNSFDYVWLDTTLYACTRKDIHFSKDHGIEFETHNEGFTAADITEITITDGKIWAHGNESTFTQESMSPQWDELTSVGKVQSLNGILIGDIDGQVKRSDDNGASWTLIPPSAFDLHSYTHWRREVYVARDLWIANLVSGAWLSYDQGFTWHPFDKINELDFGFKYASADDSNYIVTNYKKDILISGNGTDWENITYDFESIFIEPFQMVHTHNGFSFACTDQKLYRLFPGDTKWELLQYPFVSEYPNAPPLTFSCMVSYGDAIIGSSYGHGVFISVDNGSSWERINEGLNDYQINVLKIHGGKLFAGVDGGVWSRSLSELTTSIDPTLSENNAFSITPVPAKDYLTITLQQPGDISVGAISVIDVSGKHWLQQKFSSPTYTLDIQYLPPGIYFLNIHIAGKDFTERFVKE